MSLCLGPTYYMQNGKHHFDLGDWRQIVWKNDKEPVRYDIYKNTGQVVT